MRGFQPHYCAESEGKKQIFKKVVKNKLLALKAYKTD